MAGIDQVNGHANVSTPTAPIIDDVDDPTSTQGDPKGQPAVDLCALCALCGDP
jgi:hypothetical protein